MKYRAFISYSHSHRVPLAAALEAALHRFGLPEHEPNGLLFFRDSTNLSASPELWPDIQRALDDSEYFILLASPEAAASRWVQQEVAHWRTHRPPGRTVLVLADGEIHWGEQDFDFAATTALPRTIGGAFATVPFWVDLRAVKPAHYDVAYPAFCDAVATIAARLQGRGKEDLVGVYVANRLAAEASRLAAEAELALRDELPQRSVLLSCAALQLTHERGLPRLPRAEATLRATLSRFGGRPLGAVHPGADGVPATFSADGRWLATLGSDGAARLWALDDTAEPPPRILRDQATMQKLLFTQNPRWLLSATEPTPTRATAATTLRLWDAKGDFAQWHDLAGADGESVTTHCLVNKEGSHLAAQFAGAATVRVWELPDLENGGVPRLLTEIPTGSVTALAFAKNPLRLIAGASDGTIGIWNLDGSDLARNRPSASLRAGGEILQLAVSPAGTVLAARAKQRAPQLWRLDVEKIEDSRVEFKSAETPFFHLEFSPKGGWLLCVGDASYALPLRGEEGVEAFELITTGGRVWKHAFSADERWLATATGLLRYEELAQAIEPEYVVRLWDLDRGKPWRLTGHQDIVTDVAFTPDGSRLISGALDRTVRIWNCDTARKFQEARQDSTNARAGLAEPPGGWDQHEDEHVLRSFARPKVLLAEDDQIFHVVPSPDGIRLLTISCGTVHRARLWLMFGDPWCAAPLFLPTAMAGLALALPHPQKWLLFSELARASNLRTGFSKAERWFFLQSGEASVRVYDLATNGVATVDLKTAGTKITWTGWSPDERWFIAISETTATGLFELRLWDLRINAGETPPGTAVTSSRAFLPPEFSADGRWLLGLRDEAGCLWDLHLANPLAAGLVVPGADAVVDATFHRALRMAFSPDGRWLINAANQAAIWLHDLRAVDPRQPWATWLVDATSIRTLASDEQGRFIFAGGAADFGRLWHVSPTGTTSLCMEIRGHKNVERAVFSQNGRWLITRDFDAIQLWDLVARECRCVLPKAEGDVQIGLASVFLADDRWAVLSKWKAVILIDLATPESAAVPVMLPGHEFGQVGFWFTPDHRWLVTADFPFEELRGRGPAPAVQIWDLLSPRPQETAGRLPGLEAGVKRINISSDGQWLSTTSQDGVRLWPLGTAQLLALAKATVGREFNEAERRRYHV